MLKFARYVQPQSAKQALSYMQDDCAAVAGGVFINLANQEVQTAVDLSSLGLDFISDKGDSIEIGAMTTLREVETSSLLAENFGGILPKAASFIMGVQLRNLATFGAPIAAKIGFSNILTSVLAIGGKLVFAGAGEVDIEKFVQNPQTEKDLLEKIVLSKQKDAAFSFSIYQKSTLDFPVLNVALNKAKDCVRIAVGARPSPAILCKDAQSVFKQSGDCKKAAVAASEEIEFGDNLRGSAEYRKLICKTLVEKALLEVKNG